MWLRFFCPVLCIVHKALIIMQFVASCETAHCLIVLRNQSKNGEKKYRADKKTGPGFDFSPCFM